jgi:hypothetical protein
MARDRSPVGWFPTLANSGRSTAPRSLQGVAQQQNHWSKRAQALAMPASLQRRAAGEVIDS